MKEAPFDIAAHLFDQAQGVAVAAEQQMLAVVQLRAIVLHAPGPSAELFGAFENGGLDAVRGKLYGGCHAGVAAADDADLQFLSHARNASHSL